MTVDGRSEQARVRWARLVARLAVDPEKGGPVGDALVEAYTGPGRHHHDVGHVVEVLDALVGLLGPPLPVEAELAVWFHDAVYEGRAGDDEAASAALARKELTELGLASALVERVAMLVEATASHTCTHDDEVGAAFLDADLSVLGANPRRYDAYVEAVRREYAHLDDAEWQQGRTAVLTSLLERDHLFLTAAGRNRWEEPARANMTRERAALETQ